MSFLRPLIITALLAGIVYYVWRRLVRDTGLRGWARIAATAAIVALPVPMLVVAFSSPGGPPLVRGAPAWPTYLMWAALGLTFVALLLVDLGRAAIWAGRKVARRPVLHDPSRREAIARITGGVAVGVVAGQVALGVREVVAGPDVVEEEVALERLPAPLDGFSIVQLTDLHIGGTVGRAFIEDVVRRANAAAPDLIVLTGDLVDGSVAELRHAAAPLAELRAPHGVWSVTGNHEFYSGADAWVAHLATLGIRTLRNQRVPIERGGAGFDLAGVDDHSHGADVAAALAGRDPARAVVLLAHQPRQLRDAARHDVCLQLSGHTHGGQVWPWHYLVSLQQGGLVAGRYREGRTQLYVSRGTGHWGPPMRVAAPAEITRIVLRAKTA